MRITAVIIDDEPSSRSVLRNLLAKFCDNVEIVGEASTVTSGYDLIIRTSPKLIFLDIQMPDGNGFSLLKKFTTIPFQIIFVTSFNQYAIDAIRYSALDYLLKPIEVKELVSAINRVKISTVSDLNPTYQVINLLNNANELEVERKLAIHDKGKVKFIKLNEIIYLEAEINYTHIHLITGEELITTRILKDLEDVLESTKLFIRVNKTSAINANYVKSYSKKEPFILTLINGKEFEVSRRKKAEVNERLASL